jgi:hypothetical protein
MNVNFQAKKYLNILLFFIIPHHSIKKIVGTSTSAKTLQAQNHKDYFALYREITIECKLFNFLVLALNLKKLLDKKFTLTIKRFIRV